MSFSAQTLHGLRRNAVRTLGNSNRMSTRTHRSDVVAPQNLSSPRSSSAPRQEFDREWIDPRPPWLYTGVKWLTRAAVPGIFLYCVLVHDFGPDDHVFVPLRSWVDERTVALKTRLFSLTPEERQLALKMESERPHPPPADTQN